MGASLDVGQEVEQPALIVAFGKSFPGHQAPLLQDSIAMEESVGGDKVYARMIGPAGETGTQDTGKGALSDRDAAGYADDVGHTARVGSSHKLQAGLV